MVKNLIGNVFLISKTYKKLYLCVTVCVQMDWTLFRARGSIAVDSDFSRNWHLVYPLRIERWIWIWQKNKLSSTRLWVAQIKIEPFYWNGFKNDSTLKLTRSRFQRCIYVCCNVPRYGFYLLRKVFCRVMELVFLFIINLTEKSEGKVMVFFLHNQVWNRFWHWSVSISDSY